MRVLELPRFGWLPNIRNVQVQTHSRCNADCLFCPYIESEHAADPGRMSNGTWHLILSNLRAFSAGINIGKFCPYLMQEPLIDPSIFAKIADIYRCFPRTCVEVSTNGAALTEKNVALLLASMRGKRHDIWVSHHGIDAKTLEDIMRIDYEKATRNLITLLRAADGKHTIKVRGAGMSRDKKHVYFTRGQYFEWWNRLVRDNSINTRGVSIDYFTFHDRAGTLHRDRSCSLNMGTQRTIDAAHPFHCNRVDEWIHFMHDGRIRLCCMDYHGEVRLPNINEVSLLDYFHGPEYTDLVRKVGGTGPHEDGFICTRCTSPGG